MELVDPDFAALFLFFVGTEELEACSLFVGGKLIVGAAASTILVSVVAGCTFFCLFFGGPLHQIKDNR